MAREADFTTTFVALADLLIGEYDVAEFCQTLVDRCCELVDADAVGMLVTDDAGELRVAAASTGTMVGLELLELQQQEGPCFEAAHTGERVHDHDLQTAADRWPEFARRATELGLRSVHGFPLRVRDERLGALNVFFARSGPFSGADLDALQALADLAAIGISQQHTVTRRHAAEQEALAELAELSLLDEPLEQVFARVRSIVVDLFEASVCLIQEHSAADQLVRLGDDEGADALPDDPGSSQAGHALSVQRAVVVENLATETRFRDDPLLEQGLVAGITAVIPGERRPFGTLGVHTNRPRSFAFGDVAFLDNIATMLGSVIARRTAEAQLRQAQKLDAVGQLATGVAHDFNNLLQVIHGNAELLRLDGSGPQLRAILKASDQARRLVSQLLTFSRQYPSERRSVDLNVTIAAVTDMVDRIMGPDVSMKLDLTRPLPRVTIDPSQLEQVVMNLLVNARDAMPDGGTISVLTRSDAGAAEDGRPVRLVVSDTGSGMTEEVRARALEPFFTTKAPDRGTGMGLATVYGVVSAAGGTLDIDTAPGRGTSVIIDLACSDDRPETRPAAEAGGSPRTPTGRIMVVDDEQEIVDLVAAALLRSGHEVVRAGSAREALELLDEGPPIELLLTDLLMPGMNGLELAREVRQRQGPLPVVLMSGNAPAEVGREPDMATLAKPFALTSLLDEVGRMLAHVQDGRSSEPGGPRGDRRLRRRHHAAPR